ncbi:MAG: hypothetical protein HZR80_20255 [Candidatus Heimdallarchaeota archaeon]
MHLWCDWQIEIEKEILKLLKEKPFSTNEIRKIITADNYLLVCAIRRLRYLGLTTMIKQGRKFPYALTDKGISYVENGFQDT